MLKLAPPKSTELCQISELTVLIASFGDGLDIKFRMFASTRNKKIIQLWRLLLASDFRRYIWHYTELQGEIGSLRNTFFQQILPDLSFTMQQERENASGGEIFRIFQNGTP